MSTGTGTDIATGTPPIEPRADLALMAGYHSPQLDVAVRLNTNEAPEPPPAAFTEALAAEVAATGLNRYPDRGATELRAAIGAFHGVDAGQVFVANGSNEVLQTLCLTYGGPGRRAATFEPTYALHAHIARITGTEVVTGSRDDDFSIGEGELARVIDGARPEVCFLCSPNNPSGTLTPAEVIADIAERAAGLVIVDEAYGQFAPTSALDLVADDRPLVVTRTYSKTWAMAGARLGYAIAPAWLVAELDKVALPYHVDAIKQAAGRLALDHRAAMEERVAALVAGREHLEAALVDLGFDVWPSGSNFVLFRTGGLDADAVWQGLVERSVLVRNCASWPRLAGCLRVTVGTPAENATFLDALADIVENDAVAERRW